MATLVNNKINTKKRWFIFIIVNLLPFFTACAYLILKSEVEAFGKSIAVCAMHDFFHLYCPACGGTRAVKAILSFDFLTALKCNPSVLLAFVYFIYYDIRAFVNIIRKKEKVVERIHPFAPISLLVVFIGYAILRNVLLVYFNVDFIGDFR